MLLFSAEFPVGNFCVSQHCFVTNDYFLYRPSLKDSVDWFIINDILFSLLLFDWLFLVLI